VLATHDCGSRCQLHHGDMCDPCCLARLVAHIRPDEVYNLAAQSHVGVSFEIPAYTTDVNGNGALHLLEAIRLAGLQHSCRFYQASTSEMFGKVLEPVQSERTAFNPRSPYACAKLFAHTITKNYRDAYGMYAVCGLLFNHESPRRGELFVTRKISLAVAAIAAGHADCMVLGNLDTTRDWGHARDYVVAMHAMLQQPTPEDFVVATGETRSVRAFVEAAFKAGGMGSVLWQGTGLDEVAVLQAPHTAGRVVVRLSAEFTRPSEVDALIGDPRKAVATLGFNPRATPFEQLVAEMVHADMVRLAEMRTPGLVICTPEQRATSSAPAEEDHEMPMLTI
jgi:GDPmannose 4,6-dehydratase